jgi:hypothetical protein
MRSTRCARETEVLAATRRDSWPTALRQHLRGCAPCADTVAAERVLRLAARELPGLNELPDPALLWWRSRHQYRVCQVERATLPIRLVERLTLACGAVGLAVAASLGWPLVRPALSRWLGSWAIDFARTSPLEGPTLLLLLGSSVLALAVFGLYAQWAED